MRSEMSFAIALVSLVFEVTCAWAAPTIAVTPKAPHPSQIIDVTGSGFAPGEAVSVYKDLDQETVVRSSSVGAFMTSFPIPVQISSGTHTIRAVGKRRGDSAETTVYVTTPWRQFGFNSAHSGFNPFETILAPYSVPALGRLWSNKTLPGNGSTPVVVAPYVYVTLQKGVAALNATTGAVAWTALTSDYFASSPTLESKVVYVASLTGRVYALDPKTGATLWARPLGGDTCGSPAVSDNVIYIGGNSSCSALYALQVSTGEILWRHAVEGRITGTPAVANGIIYVSGDYGRLYAFNAATGALVWRGLVSGRVDGSPTVANGVVYVAKDYVYAFNAETGTLLWQAPLDSTARSTPAVAYGFIYVGADLFMYALNAHTGAGVWTFMAADSVASVAAANGVVYFTSVEGAFYALSAWNGALLAKGAPGSTEYGSSPAISDGVVYLTVPFTTNGSIIAFAPGAGRGSTPQSSKR